MAEAEKGEGGVRLRFPQAINISTLDRSTHPNCIPLFDHHMLVVPISFP
jgi:hypothetical protein